MPNFASLLIGNKIFKDFSMDWINDLLWGEGIGHSILLLSFVIAAGIQLGKIKVFGISLGITLVLFVGIILGHFGFTVNHNVIHFFKEFGLILFVYSVGMQVGPGFFSSFRQGGITLNMLACGIVFLGVATALVLHFVTGIPMPTMVGILSGAVTNTPGLGAAQQAYSDMYGVSDNTIALGYAVAYPLGVIGIILSIIFVRYVFRVNFDKENDDLNKEDASHTNEAKPISLVVKNPAVFGKTVGELSGLMDHLDFVISRVWRNDNKQIEIASAGTILNEDDKIFVITTDQDAESVKTFIGEEIDMERKQWIRMESQFINRLSVAKDTLTKSEAIRVVIHINRHGEASLQDLLQMYLLPMRDIHHVIYDPLLTIHHARHTDSDSYHALVPHGTDHLYQSLQCLPAIRGVLGSRGVPLSH